MCVVYSRPNGWTDWAEFFFGHSEGAHRQRRALQLIIFKMYHKPFVLWGSKKFWTEKQPFHLT